MDKCFNNIAKINLGKNNLGKWRCAMFIGRDEELKELKERYKTNSLEIISVLGRRRVGKSQLIFNSYQDFDGLVISYDCSATSYADNLDAINKLIRKTFDNEFLSFNSLYDILVFLHKEAIHQKILFVIDEYPYMRDGKATDSEIKRAIDDFDKLNKKNPLKFILCGSSVEVMNILDDVKMPLHGRFNKIIRLFPLNYLHSSMFFENVNEEDKVKYYSVLGGVPYFLKQVNPVLSFDDNIINLFFSSNALLKSELENQINGEIAKIEKATYILNIINKKTMAYSDILQRFKASFPNGEIDYPLSKLLNMKIVEKIYVEQDNGKKKPYYRIIDNTISFYYSYLIQNFANRLLFTDKEYYEEFIKDNLLHDFVPHMFENIGYQFVALMNKNKLLPYHLIDLFKYIINDKKNKTNYQFDIVGKTKGGLINFECKYQDGVINASEVYKESRQAELANKSFIDTIFISKSKVDNCKMVYYLSDLFNKELLDN